MSEENTGPSTAKSFTTRVPMEVWEKINTYKEYGKWNTNQLMNHALSAFFDIIESDEGNPQLPLVCETLRDLSRRSRSRLISDAPQQPDPEPPTQLVEDKPWRDLPSEETV